MFVSLSMSVSVTRHIYLDGIRQRRGAILRDAIALQPQLAQRPVHRQCARHKDRAVVANAAAVQTQLSGEGSMHVSDASTNGVNNMVMRQSVIIFWKM